MSQAFSEESSVKRWPRSTSRMWRRASLRIPKGYGAVIGKALSDAAAARNGRRDRARPLLKGFQDGEDGLLAIRAPRQPCIMRSPSRPDTNRGDRIGGRVEDQIEIHRDKGYGITLVVECWGGGEQVLCTLAYVLRKCHQLTRRDGLTMRADGSQRN